MTCGFVRGASVDSELLEEEPFWPQPDMVIHAIRPIDIINARKARTNLKGLAFVSVLGKNRVLEV